MSIIGGEWTYLSSTLVRNRDRSHTGLTASCPGRFGGGTLRRVSGFVRDPKDYGDRLVYEPLGRKWTGPDARHCG